MAIDYSERPDLFAAWRAQLERGESWKQTYDARQKELSGQVGKSQAQSTREALDLLDQKLRSAAEEKDSALDLGSIIAGFGRSANATKAQSEPASDGRVPWMRAQQDAHAKSATAWDAAEAYGRAKTGQASLASMMKSSARGEPTARTDAPTRAGNAMNDILRASVIAATGEDPAQFSKAQQARVETLKDEIRRALGVA